MMTTDESYSIKFEGEHKAILEGTFRLQTPELYKEFFSEVTQKLEAASETFIVDLKGAKFMNSSGISSLGKLLILSRTLKKDIRIEASQDIPWQAKGLKSFEKLGQNISVIIE